ncbi:hypothetical protein [Streptomyces sp. CB01881]|uniref:hypothetical protein n=1 Tax=Streptomyces sp. CB01881 TaxID=2078691 RepID=UPI000CDC7449|nr:hypothetical protein [Streptomyces sp. CB01881]AUY52313.1 hypothetical protein C2142_29120 [Streptomyces sp. CB01881]TYC71735.1 hypothetical protein EH183_29095 [Streptomyces sp. CB01881]
MTQLIVLATVWVLRWLLPARGEHRAPDAQVPPTPPVICGWRKPFGAHLLIRTMPLSEPPRLVPRYLEAWEQTPDGEKTAVLQRQAKEQAPCWEKIRQRERQAAAFAAEAGLPDPLHYLGDATNKNRVLVGAVA